MKRSYIDVDKTGSRQGVSAQPTPAKHFSEHAVAVGSHEESLGKFTHLSSSTAPRPLLGVQVGAYVLVRAG